MSMKQIEEQLLRASETVKRHKRGDSISDDELVQAVKYLSVVLKFIGNLGPEYHLFNKDLTLTLHQLDDYLEARKRGD